MVRSHGVYWYCSCGRWSWVSKPACVGCQAAPPSWVTELRACSSGPRSADGNLPRDGLPLEEFVQQPKGKRAQAKARGRSKGAEVGSAAPPAGVVPDASALVEDEVMEVEGEEPPLGERLDAARAEVRELEAVSDAVRARWPGFDLALDAVRAECEQLQRARRAARPVRWRLVEAQGRAQAKAAEVAVAESHVAQLRNELGKLEICIAEATSALEAARAAQVTTDEAVAAIFVEITNETTSARANQAPDATVSLQYAEGLAAQLGALVPTSASGGDADSFHAAQRQAADLVAHLRGQPREQPPEHQGVGQQQTSGSGTATNNASPTWTRHVSARHGTSPVRSARSSSESSGRSRSRGRHDEDDALLPGQTRLDDMGIHVRATSDPFMADTERACG